MGVGWGSDYAKHLAPFYSSFSSEHKLNSHLPSNSVHIQINMHIMGNVTKQRLCGYWSVHIKKNKKKHHVFVVAEKLKLDVEQILTVNDDSLTFNHAGSITGF